MTHVPDRPPMPGERLRVSVVIPTRNEARNIAAVLHSVPAYVDEIVLVDGLSVDGTIGVALTERPDARIVEQGRTGKGNALAAGLREATGDYIMMIDADGSMDPAEFQSFIAALDAGADYVKGSRFLPAGGSTDITPLRRFGNTGLTWLTNALFRTSFTDLCYGFIACRRTCLKTFELADPFADGPSRWGDGFEIETLLNIRAITHGLVVREVPSMEHLRMFGDSHLHPFRDGVRAFSTILRERFGGTHLHPHPSLPHPAHGRGL